MCDPSTWSSFGSAFSDIGSAVGGAAESFGSAIGSIPGAVSDFGSSLYDMLGSGAQDASANVGGFLGGGGQEFAGAGSNFTPGIPIQSVSPIFDPYDPLGALGGGAAGAGQVLQGGTAPLMPVLQSPLGQALGPLQGPVAPPTDPSLFSQGSGFLKDNYKWMLPALGIGYSALRSDRATPGEGQLNAYAQRMGQMGNQLTDPLMTGQLPPGYQSAFDRMQQSAEAAIKSKYAKMGISGSSMERSELAAVPQQLETQKLQLAQSLASQGMQAMGLGSAAYNQIAQNTIAQDKELSNALAAFGAAAIRG
jgi:hypothetical protein